MQSFSLENRLDEFSSYSVHYILLATRTTTEALDFVDEKKNTETLANIEKVQKLGEAVPSKHPDSVFLVIDTRRFSQYTIDNLKYEVLVNGLERPGGSPGNLSTQVTMNILDSNGITFINFLQWLIDKKMKTNFDGMVFMLRVLFVGHRPDGKTETVQTVTIPMHLFKMEVNLDFAKGVYACEFMPNVNFDAKRHDRWLNIGNASSYFTGHHTNNLGDIIDNFERTLNEASALFHKQANTILDERGVGERNSQNRFGRVVEYMITIPKEWRNFTYTGSGTSSALETIFKAVADKESKGRTNVQVQNGQPLDTNLAVPVGSTIPQVLDIILKQVFQVSKLGAGDPTSDSVTFFKYLVGITSDETRFIIHVDVIEFVVPKSLVELQKQGLTTNADKFYKSGPGGVRIPNNYAEFDYTFTGKNKDVLNFDMKMQDLTWMLAANMNLGPEALPGVREYQNDKKGVKVNRQGELVQARPYDPLLLPKQTAEELQNFANYASLMPKTDDPVESSQKYTRNLSMYYAASPITAIMTIKGNPAIMTKFNVGTFLKHDPVESNGVGVVTRDKSAYLKDLEERILKGNVGLGGEKVLESSGTNSYRLKSLGDQSYTAAPVFVKVNIKGPNVDFQTHDTIKGQDFAKEILEDNYYVVMKVTNNIEGGMFTQTLELYSHNIFGAGKMVEKASPPVPMKAPTA